MVYRNIATSAIIALIKQEYCTVGTSETIHSSIFLISSDNSPYFLAPGKKKLKTYKYTENST